MTPFTLPTEASPFTGRYALWVGLMSLLIGLLLTGISLWFMLLSGEFNGGIVGGLAVIAVSIRYLTGSYFSVAPNRLTVYNLIGRPVRRYPFASFDHIILEGDCVYIESKYAEAADNRQRVSISRFLVRSEDWARLAAMQGGE